MTTTEQAGAATGSGPLSGTAVVGVDGTEAALHALQRTAAVLRATGGRMVVVFARQLLLTSLDDVTGAETTMATEAIELDEQTARQDAERIAREAGVACEFVERDGDPAQVLLEVAEETDAACIVVGAPVHGAITSILFSSVAEYLLHHCPRTLVIVRPAAESA